MIFFRHPTPWRWEQNWGHCPNGSNLSAIIDAKGEVVANSYGSRICDDLWDIYLALTEDQIADLGGRFRKCMGCGVVKDPKALELYPYPEDNSICDEPVPPLFEVDAEPWDDVQTEDWRRVTVCHHCWRKLDADMWISSRCWKSIDPVTKFEDLPLLKEETE